MCVVLVNEAGESCNSSVEFNCVNIIPFVSEWKKKVTWFTGAVFQFALNV